LHDRAVATHGRPRHPTRCACRHASGRRAVKSSSSMSSSSVSMPLSDQARTAGSLGVPVLELENLYHRWKGPKPPVLDDVSLTLRSGEISWIGGRNGVGKTTLLRLAAGI